jgi:acetoin utilization protein AcuB
MPADATTVAQYMTLSPLTVDAQATLNHAHRILRERGVRHLPVTHQGKLVGIVSARDLAMLETFPDIDRDVYTVEHAMRRGVYTVPPTSAVRDVALAMSRKKLGCAVVIRDSNVLGIFTTVDACRALAEAEISSVGRDGPGSS